MSKLQELTDRLYSEGLSKGKEEGEKLLQQAGKQAEETLAEAKAQAAAIIAKAQKDAADLVEKAESDVRKASEQALQTTKTEIENLLLKNVCGAKVSEALSSPDFLKEIIKTVAEKFSAEQATDLSLVLPAALQDKLEPFVKGELAKTLSKGVDVQFSKKIAGGLTIGPKDGGYYISLTDETFKSLIGEYLRPATKKLLFG
jgi:V/A-type H+/Na+-transporting ATPase subunit E